MPIRARQRKQADRTGESQRVVQPEDSPLRSRKERINENLPGRQQYTYTTTHRRSLAGVMREDIHNTASSLRPFDVSRAYMHTAAGVSAWSSWHSRAVSLHRNPWTFLSAPFAFCRIPFLLSVRKDRQKQPARRSTLLLLILLL